jgi:hypothetical protein
LPMPYDKSLQFLTRTPQASIVKPFMTYNHYAKY